MRSIAVRTSRSWRRAISCDETSDDDERHQLPHKKLREVESISPTQPMHGRPHGPDGAFCGKDAALCSQRRWAPATSPSGAAEHEQQQVVASGNEKIGIGNSGHTDTAVFSVLAFCSASVFLQGVISVPGSAGCGEGLL